ncbi:MAG: hypothetical protein EOO43_25380 [Flavobacterium sp.]|nr:MAG: hypothetical protein EOO43_25380 [Flavobacterium sp.]
MKYISMNNIIELKQWKDMQRFKQDREANNIPATVYNYQSKRFEQRKSKDILVGDLVRIQQDEVIAADILIIKTSAESGLAFVNTMNLDGEVISLFVKHVLK